MNNKSHAIMMITTMCAAASMANASIVTPDEPGIFAPCDNAQAEIFWIGSDAGYTGELSYINPQESGNDISLWTNHSATAGQSVILPGLFNAGDRLDFSYEVIRGGLDFFSTANEADWGQFSIDATNPHDVYVGIEDIRLPGGDSDHNDAEFHIVFTCDVPATPTPGTAALLGAGGLMIGRRRRK